jgi:DNA gyrase subunit A
MTLQPNDKIVSADVVSPTGSLLVVTRRGYGKLSEMRRYRQQKRGGKGLITLKIARKNGRVAAAQVVDREVDGDDTVLILTEKAQVIRVHLNEIRETGRITQGVIMAVPDTGDAVSAIRAMKTREAPADLLSEEEIEAAGKEPESQNGTVTDELVEGSEDMASDESAPEAPDVSEPDDSEDEAPETEEED